MIINVVDHDGVDHPFPEANRFSTDEANNLCVYQGPDADQLVNVFATGWWREAGLVDRNA